jgi:CheY-like chemotaxis protein
MLVLFIDDDQEDYEVFCEALRSANPKAECLHALNGYEALNMLTNVLFVLPEYIFLDVNMPVMGGEECLINLKKNPKFKDIPVIVYSTTTNVTEISIFKKLGALEFVIKPPRFEELAATLKRILI